MMDVIPRLLPPRFKRRDLSPEVPFIFAKLNFWRWTYYVNINGQNYKLFSKLALWPSRTSHRKAIDLAARIDKLLELTYERGLHKGMKPDDFLAEPIVKRDEEVPYFVQLFPFIIRRMGPRHWLVAYGGTWAADLRLRKTGIEMEVRANV